MSESRGDALLEEDKFTQPLQPPLLMASPSCPPSTSTAQHVVGTDESDNDATATTGTKVPQKEGDTQELSTAAKLKLLCKAGGTAVRSLWKVTPVKGWSRSFKVFNYDVMSAPLKSHLHHRWCGLFFGIG